MTADAVALVTVLGARPGDRQALVRSLRARLRGRQRDALHLPCLAVPRPWQAGWIPARAHERARALAASPIVLHESSLVHAMAQGLPEGAAPELPAAAQAELAGSALVLLCAPSADEAAALATDLRLRQWLVQVRAGFSIVGSDAASARQAWQALCLTLGWPLDAGPEGGVQRRLRWRGPCDTCSDPACEHRVFSDLLAQRARA
ncbi:hypothetical protein [Xenophilus sp. Marseille-Q4582]|uniref:hypothetical protein n=1 Tax=Xenophilus sp. Marseille-Q4582 TaxID=2866600 RepID=UPI001CE3C109|nr:hypothetical protein [Xenophilus sp. Marseille-Q4582]